MIIADRSGVLREQKLLAEVARVTNDVANPALRQVGPPLQ